MVRNRVLAAILAACAIFLAVPALAQNATLTTPTPQNEAAEPEEQPSISSTFPALGEFKRALLARGYNLQLNYYQEVLGNPSGGVYQGGIYEALFEMSVDGDLDTIAGLKGATFHINAYEILGRGLSTYNIFNYSTISGIEARRTTRLYEAYLEQEFFDGKVALRIGQLAADTEFVLSDYDGLFLNGTYGWPNITANNMPGTGPGYPMTTPGVRLKLKPDDKTMLLLAVFNGDPAGVGLDTAEAQYANTAGINFRLRDPPLVFGEVQHKYALPFGDDGLEGKIRVGGWRHFGKFDDIYYGIDGLSIVNPEGDGVPLVHNGDYGVYSIIDQMVWRKPGDDPFKGVGVYGFLMYCPPDRNQIELEAQAGVSFTGMWDLRPNDIFGVAAALTKLSPSVQRLDGDSAHFVDPFMPVRNYELQFELTYQVHVIPGLIVQPDFQYIHNPGAGAANPINPRLGRIQDAAVFGLRVGAKF